MTAPATRPNLTAGTIGAVAGALLGAVAWALLTSVTNYKIGYAAVGVGALTGLFAGRLGGGAPQLPVISAVIGLVGCLLGDVFTSAHALAKVTGLSSFSVLTEHTHVVWLVYKDQFGFLDVVFYVFAAVAAFRLATAHGLVHQQQTQWAPPAGPPASTDAVPPPAGEPTPPPPGEPQA
jgi:hypothetical protein